jgi:hypothetical protein
MHRCSKDYDDVGIADDDDDDVVIPHRPTTTTMWNHQKCKNLHSALG